MNYYKLYSSLIRDLKNNRDTFQELLDDIYFYCQENNKIRPRDSEKMYVYKMFVEQLDTLIKRYELHCMYYHSGDTFVEKHDVYEDEED